MRDQLDAAAVACGKLVKKLRQWVNRKEAAAADLEDARSALEAVRRIHQRHGLECPDWDGRLDKGRRREEDAAGAYPDRKAAVLDLLKAAPAGLTVLQIADALQGKARQADGEFAGILSSLLQLQMAGDVHKEGDRYRAEA